MSVSHDQNFKNLIIDYPRKALELFAPEEAAHFGEGVIFTPIREEQLKDRLSDRFLELDIPLLAQWPDGRREALLFVVEQQTHASGFSTHKLARYCLSLAELFETDRVVPVVIFLRRPRRLRRALRLRNEFFEYLHFRYLACVLPDMPAQQYLDSDNLVARLNLPSMYWPGSMKVEICWSTTNGLFTLEPDPERRLKYAGFIDIYMTLDDNERALFEQRYQQEGSDVVGFVEHFTNIGIEKGSEKGRKQGLEAGRASEARAILTRLLVRRFGSLPAVVEAKIERAGIGQLEAWADQVLDAGSLEEMFPA